MPPHAGGIQGDLPETVARVARFLAEARVEARLQELRTATASAEEAASAVGCRLDEIVKSLLFLCDDDPVLVLVPGSRRVDLAKVTRAVGAQTTRIAPPAVAREVTGFEVGGIAPLPPARVRAVLADRSLLASTIVWIGAGSDRHLAAIAPAELVRLARAETVDLCQEGESRLTRILGT
jgi:prolyl-tRNA editing enzyme YbaK/EbsC (Cys-tRNA(Pro) deacylase)